MVEHLYCVLSPGWDHCKLGRWSGHYVDLWARYATQLGPDLITVIVFECHGSRVLERMLFGYVRKLHLSGEVYLKEALEPFLQFCNVMCHDSVRQPTSRSIEERNVAKEVRRKRKQTEQENQQAAKKQRAAKMEEDLDSFIESHCERDPSYRVKEAQFNKRVQDVTAQRIKTQLLKSLLKQRGISYHNLKVVGRVYRGLRLLDD